MIRVIALRDAAREESRPCRAGLLPILMILCACPALRADDGIGPHPHAAASSVANVRPNQPAGLDGRETTTDRGFDVFDRQGVARTLPTVALFGLISLAPFALLMLTGFVRISIVLTLLRQALGSPQVPGNQVINALALLLTALLMWPHGEAVYRDGIAPYAEGRADLAAAWEAGSKPIRDYMLKQIVLTRHESYLEALHEYAVPASPGRAIPPPGRLEDYPFRVIAPAFLLSELTTALWIGFMIYLPFLVVDLVVAAVLAATGLFMLPPSLVATPVKLVLFVLADGWILVASMLLSTFGPAGG